ncbi:nucleoside/nucleotide kinase family protein [Devosia sp. XJ19-1]|uniref:Nucleoside/nucleotide kinase family protein n=1 Tax=Devosia ureilytica TaxID=2952754 RepID=A0A9Q4AS19_9HYPH|nr:nucleoside/nucleotide kinase family protein [Devosia ureilytica]MCP8885288.1 nucleoside/nucleotide kinase family protein [Devosia ureilytica]MCP8888746.1 nucleoside/nucleotide kinase family protein [Devosia ureilytica]
MPETMQLTPQGVLSRLVPHILEMESAAGGRRIAIGMAGGPGTGKSTLAAELVAMLNAVRPGSTALVPMDGFHMKHAKIEAMGETGRKGAPHTFEGAAFVSFLHHLKRAAEPVSGPGYSRKIEDTVDDAFTVAPDVKVLVVEGNYLLLTQGPWAGVKSLLDYAVFIHVPRDLVEARLLKRHGEEGLFSEERNRAHIARNDLPNYDLVEASRERADVVFEMDVAR